ncbi:MAG: DUF4369 domain-containing protein [Algicola sp.]|nr:DUF4369 domain-containing protein [Algicola sp.]
MKKLLLALLLLAVIACQKNTQNLTVKGEIKGLKKGTLYLEREQDSALVVIDSIVLNGISNFQLHAALEAPEALSLRLDKNSPNTPDERLLFFADKGITEINTSLKNFAVDAEIRGSKQHVLYEQYLKVIGRFNDKKLELYKEKIEAIQSGDSAKIAQNQEAFNKLLKSRYLYTVNFAVTNNDSEVSPYLALTEIYDAQPKWLDTISNALTPSVKASKYGKMLDKHIAEQKKRP